MPCQLLYIIMHFIFDLICCEKRPKKKSKYYFLYFVFFISSNVHNVAWTIMHVFRIGFYLWSCPTIFFYKFLQLFLCLKFSWKLNSRNVFCTLLTPIVDKILCMKNRGIQISIVLTWKWWWKVMQLIFFFKFWKAV